MFDRCFSLVYEFAKHRKRLLLFIILVILTSSLLGISLIEFDSDISLMVPKHEAISRNINFFRSSNISGKVVISLGLTSDGKGIEELLSAVDDVASSLDPKLFPEVSSGISKSKMAVEMDVLLRHLPQVFSKSDMSVIDAMINRKYVSERLSTIYMQMLKPGGIFLNSMFRSDPLGVNLLVIEKLKSLSASTGYEVEMRDEHFLSKNGTHAMIIASTPVLVTDTSGVKELFASLRKTIGKLPEYISSDIISGHSHTLSNEQIIKRDIRLTLGIASVLFLILFVIVLRDISALLIYMIPMISVIASINLSYLLIGRLSYSVIGLGAVVAGISVDYGIHIYIAARSGKDPVQAVKHVAKPVVIGGMTTIGIFLAFFFSSIEGYHQMAIFSIISIVLALLFATVALPHFLFDRRGNTGFKDRLVDAVEDIRLSNNISVFLWVILTLILAWFSLNVNFDSSLRAVDGTSKEILRAEKRFGETWGQKQLAVLVAEAKDYEDALELNEKLYREAAGAIGAENFLSLASLWPSKKTRKENFTRWKRFWKDGREQELRKLLEQEGVKFRFSSNAFDPFFENLDTDPGRNGPGFGIVKRFVQKKGGGYRLLSYFPDKKEYTASISAISRRYPGTYLVSGRIMSETVSEVVTADIKKMTLVASAFVILLTFFFMRNIREAAVALVPVVTSVIWLLGMVSLIGLSLNVANLIAYIVAMGLCVDYGIFMTYRSRMNIRSGTVLAVTLSAVSTLMGAGVLLFAKHPALFSIGITMVIGVGAGYLSSMLVVPRLYELLVGRKNKEVEA